MTDEHNEHDNIDTEAPSKSARKREAHAKLELGRQLGDLPADQLDRLTLDEPLRQALGDYQRIRSHGARKRQLQFIGRLLRERDTAQIEQALEELAQVGNRAKYILHQAEHWRDQLLSNDDALTEFLHRFPGSDAQQLRHHIKAARRTDDKAAFRNLLRFIRDNPAADWHVSSSTDEQA
jgi:ribosome-associated protein